MFSAEEARALTIGGKSEREKQQLEAAYRNIKQAVKNGSMWCYCYEWLNPPVIAELENLGYRVQRQSDQRDGTMFKISW
ncbi:hypothetical protein [Niameybacter massiliensis]|uniref:hypothetical protein n=1 Tax=Niameybacter massiliensis TaxID=1658108 RepID=UPI0006B55E08|nr:hypothetical protein [Niameybacter massiliensis]